MELKGKKFVFLGDSITEGVGTTAPDKVFHQIIKENCGLNSAYNAGISGTRIGDSKKSRSSCLRDKC